MRAAAVKRRTAAVDGGYAMVAVWLGLAGDEGGGPSHGFNRARLAAR